VDRDEQTVTLKDGRLVRIRPLRPDDGPGLVAGFDRLSELSRYRRFLTGKTHLTQSELRYLTSVDGVDHAAFVAIDPERPSDDGNPEGLGIGVARYIRSATDPDTAEAAIAVIDEYQDLGVGKALLTALGRRAAANGVVRFTGDSLADNEDVTHLLQSFGIDTEIDIDESGTMHARVDLGDVPDR
jgi:GNAT superfamily N-acetyltransferase